MSETIKLDINAMVERFRLLGKLLAPTVYQAMLISAHRMVYDVVKKRMSGPRGAPGILGRVTGIGVKSMVDVTEFGENTIRAILGSSRDYIAAHEEGFSGPVNVRAHVRRNLKKSYATRGARKGLLSKRYISDFKSALSKGHNLTSNVRPHSRKVNIIAKHFIRDTVIAAVPPTERRIQQALLIAVKTGRVPTSRELGA